MTISLENTIESIDLFLVSVEDMRKFSFGIWTSRQHVFVCVHSGNCTGYGENILTVNTPEASLDEWAGFARLLSGLSISSALSVLRDKRGVCPDRFVEMMEMAIVDLAGKVEGVPSLSYFSLETGPSVQGLYVILDDNIDNVRSLTEHAASTGRGAAIKVKLFGDVEKDLAIVRSVRSVLPRDVCHLLGDANDGYGGTVDEIAPFLIRLGDAGLDALEDPGRLSVDEWCRLQSLVFPLALVPDVPMRPSRDAITRIKPGMGRMYNIHPGCTGSFIDAIELALHIKRLGGDLMIGDDSLIGPACTIWQQTASALSALYVEALEKEKSSDVFFSSLVSKDAEVIDGVVGIKGRSAGFGLDLSLELLCSLANAHVHIGK